VPDANDRICTRSQSWLASQRPRLSGRSNDVLAAGQRSVEASAVAHFADDRAVGAPHAENAPALAVPDHTNGCDPAGLTRVEEGLVDEPLRRG